jgi:hypothetical protein
MVELVLRRPRRVALEVVPDVVPVLVLALDPDFDGPLHGGEHALQRQASLVIRLELVAPPDDDGVHERADAVVPPAEDEHAPQDADLRRRQADAARLLHQDGHASHEAPEVVVEPLDGPRLHAEDRIGVLADLREREPAPRLAFGVELLLADLAFDRAHGGHTTVVDRREREAIMRQGVVRAETPRDRAERQALEADLVESPLAGKPLPRRLRNFRPAADNALRALGGPLAWMRRLRAIEVAVGEHETRLRETWDELRAAHDDDESFARAWRSRARAWDFRRVNALIDQHNRNFPAESRLPMNPRTGDFVQINGRPYTREPLDAEWILARFPPPR